MTGISLSLQDYPIVWPPPTEIIDALTGSVGYVLDLFGKLRRSERAAWAQVLAVQANEEALINSMIATVITARVDIATAQRRLAIARAMIHDPSILLLDEPYTGLDQDASLVLDNILKQIASQGRTVVMTSHDLSRSADLASRFDVLSRGQIVASAQRSEMNPNLLLSFYREATSISPQDGIRRE